jgi:outer membrane autotransporter protein
VASDADGNLGGLADGGGQDWSVWGAGMGRWSQTGMDNGIAGSSDSASGFALGADRSLSPSLAVGAAFSFSSTDLASAGVIATTRSYAGAAYVTWTPGDWVIDARLAGGPVNGHSNRIVSVAGANEVLTGTPDGWGFLAAAETGYRLAVYGAEIEPYAGLTMQTYGQGAYGETGSVGLDFPHQYFSRVQPALGARLAGSFEIAGLAIDPHADVAWTHDLGDAGLTTQAIFFDVPFQIDAARPGRDAARVGAGFSVRQSNSVSLFLGYDGEFRGNADSHAVTGGIRVTL